MNHTVHGISKSQTRLSDFHFHQGRDSVLCLLGQTLMLDTDLPSLHSVLVPKWITECLIHPVVFHTALLLIREERVSTFCLWNSPRSPPS